MAETVITPIFRVQYPNVFSPYVPRGASEESGKFSITMIFDPDKIKADAQEKAKWDIMEALIEEAIQTKWGSNRPALVKKPLKKGLPLSDENPNGFDLSKNPAYENMIIGTARTKFGPIGVIDQKTGQEIIVPDKLYAGCYARAEVSFYGFDYSGNKGVAMGFNAILKTDEGEPLKGGKKDPADTFKDYVTAAPSAASNADLL